jgi:CubicO group peptidase (beta-lactamase class C family)
MPKHHGFDRFAALRPLRVLACSLVFSLGASQVVRADAIDDYLSQERASRQIPGMALAIVRHGKIERISTYGIANLETGTPVTPDSIFAIASLDKAVTATGVMKAAELGKLSVDDPIAKYVNVPLPGVTIAMLLGHTSGLADMESGLIPAQYGSHPWQHYTTAELLAAIQAAPLLTPPGSQYSYSDAGPFLAQLATQTAVGKPWFQFMQDELFGPAQMQHVVNLDPLAIIPNRVSPYTFNAAQQLIRDDRTEREYGELYNDLGMTIGDFARWVIMLDGRGPLSEASVKRISTQTMLNDGTPAREVYSFSGYGLGMGLDDVLGERVLLHTGHSGVAWVKFPALDLGVVVFTNLEHPQGSDPVGLALAVAGMIEPRLSLRALVPPKSGEPPAAKALRHDYELFVAGKPDMQRYTQHMQPTIWATRDTFDGRLPRLGALQSWQFLRAAPVDGEASFLFRATHAHGEIYVRFSLDPAGKISRLVWWHL